MKKTACLLLSLLLLMGGLFGCSKKEDAGPKEATSKTEAAEGAGLYKIGLVQCGSYAPLDVMRESFMSRLDEWGYNETKVARSPYVRNRVESSFLFGVDFRNYPLAIFAIFRYELLPIKADRTTHPDAPPQGKHRA